MVIVMDRKKELKAQYKEMKPEMGIYIVRSKTSDKCFVEAVKGLKATINGTIFKLKMGGFPNRELQREWREMGPEAFDIEILEYLEYDNDEGKTDYAEDLALLKLIWEEKLVAQGMEFYKR